jgi:hypothetical protein
LSSVSNSSAHLFSLRSSHSSMSPRHCRRSYPHLLLRPSRNSQEQSPPTVAAAVPARRHCFRHNEHPNRSPATPRASPATPRPSPPARSPGFPLAAPPPSPGGHIASPEHFPGALAQTEGMVEKFKSFQGWL